MKSLYFLYHELRPGGSQYSYVTPCQEFEAHCELFARVRRVGADERFCPEVTFDDGNGSDLIYAQPALERHSLKATFFVTAGWTEQRTGFMNWSQLRELRACGHCIGAHGMTHKLLTDCSGTELKEELQGSRKRLEDGLGEAISIMSLPGGRANQHILRACEDAGYRQVFTSHPAAEDMDTKPKTVGRINLVSGTTVAWLEQVLDPQSGLLHRLERSAEWKSAAKRLLGDRLYARIWAIANRQESQGVEAGDALL